MKKRIRMSERELNRVISESVKSVLMEGEDTVRGRYLRYSPEECGFDSGSEWELDGGYSQEQMYNLIYKSMEELDKARDYARTMGNSRLYHLLNAVIAELSEEIR